MTESTVSYLIGLGMGCLTGATLMWAIAGRAMKIVVDRSCQRYREAFDAHARNAFSESISDAFRAGYRAGSDDAINLAETMVNTVCAESAATNG